MGRKNREGKRSIPVRILRILLWITVSIILLLVLVILLIRLPVVQNFITQKAVSYLSEKTGTEVRLNRLFISFPKKVHLQGLYLEDRSGDTLAWIGDLKVDVSLTDLLSNKVTINSVTIETLKATVYRLYPDTTFNYSFLLEAFASQDTVPKTADTGAPWIISLGDINLKDIHLAYKDTIAGLDARVDLGEMELSIKKSDFNNLDFRIDDFLLNNTGVIFVLSAPLDTTKNPDTTASGFSIALKNLRFSNIKLNYSGTADTLEAGLVMDVIRMDDLLANQDSISLGKILITNTSLSYNKQNKPAAVKGMDFNHLLVSGFNFEANTISVSPALARAELDHLSFREKSGFLVREFRAGIRYDSVHAELADLDIQTQHSRIRSHLAASYPSLQAFSDSLESVVFKIILDKATISMSDVLYFVPNLAEQPEMKAYIREHVDVTGEIEGTMAQMFVRDFDLSAGNVTRIRLDGEARNLTDTRNLYANVTLRELTTAANDLAVLVPAGIIPPEISIPEFLEARGSFKGTFENFDAVLNLNSSIGAVDAEVTMDKPRPDIPVHYTVVVKTDEFNPGKLLNQPDLGPITLELTADGSGMDTATISADINLNVRQAVLMGYNYKDLRVTGRFEKMAFDGQASMADENLTFSYKGITDLDPRNTRFDFVLYLKGADLKALGLTETDSKVSATVSADITKAPDGNFLGNASIARIMIVEGEERFTADSIRYTASQDEGKTEIMIRSQGLEVNVSGQIVMMEVATAIQKHISRYYDFSPGIDTVEVQPQNFDFRITMTDPTLIEKLIPSLDKLSPFEFRGDFDSEAGVLNINGEIPRIIYAGLAIDTLSLDIGTGDRLKYDISSAAIYNNMLRMEGFKLEGYVRDDSVIFRIRSEKEDSGMMIAISGRIIKEDDGMRMVLDEPLTLANADWKITPENFLLFGSKGMKINQLTLSREDESLSVATKGEGAEAPLEIRFDNFEIGHLSRIIEGETELVRGRMNGNFLMETAGFTSDLTIDSLTFSEIAVGDLNLRAVNKSPGEYGIELTISGGENDITLTGKYTSVEQEGRMDMVLDMRNLAMTTVEPFTFGQVTDMTGNASGNIAITGTVRKPNLEGTLHFADFGFRPKAVGSKLTIRDNDIRFSGGRVILEDFSIYDSLNNSAVLNGYADLSDLQKIGFDITMKTEDFLVMNTAYQEDEIVYGKVIIDSDIHLTGTQQAPFVDVKIRLNEGTDVTFVNPDSKAGLIEHEGVVVFVDSISRQHPIMTRADSVTKAEAVTEIDLRAVIEFDEDATLKMMVDPIAGDSLFVRGSGVLEFTLDPSGTMSLTGSYRIREGGYHLTVSGVLKRDFRMREGSKITWNGELMEAETDITAVYEVETSPLILLEEQLSGAGDEQKNKYRNELEFEVLLMMSGVIMKPEIRFDIELAEKDRGAMGGAVYAKLAELREEESQLNKQVFSLLALGRFMGTDPLESGNALTVSSAARSSASKLLTDQLNDLSQRYVTGVDLEVGVKSYEDYSSGQAEGRTELELGLSKELLEGRVIVQVGGSIDVEGEKAAQNNISDIAGNISVEYKITEDGRFRLRGFRTNEYENPIEGELTKTGIGLIYTRDFNKIRDIYVKKEGKQLDEK